MDIVGIPVITDPRVAPHTFYLGLFTGLLPDDVDDWGPPIVYVAHHLHLVNPRAKDPQ